MPTTARRLLLIASASLAVALSACTNPVAPSGAKPALPPAHPNAGGVYMGGVG